jgi:hydrocephalus-inducing protein
LNGHCISPRPQGPIILKAGAPASVSFKNVFNTNATFALLVDNPSVIVKASETIPSKKTVQIQIGYKTAPPAQGADKAPQGKAGANAAANHSKNGKLTITNQNTNVTWVYYLKYVPI